MKNKMRIKNGDAYFCDECGFQPTYKSYTGEKVNYRGGLKLGWNNGAFCCKSCEVSAIKELFSTMPGHGGEYHIPTEIKKQINDRWEVEE